MRAHVTNSVNGSWPKTKQLKGLSASSRHSGFQSSVRLQIAYALCVITSGHLATWSPATPHPFNRPYLSVRP